MRNWGGICPPRSEPVTPLTPAPEQCGTTVLTITVSDEVRSLAPGFTHRPVEAHGLVDGPSDENGSALLDDAPRRLTARLGGRAPHEDPHAAAWRDMCTAFGAKPSRINRPVDLSTRSAWPV